MNSPETRNTIGTTLIIAGISMLCIAGCNSGKNARLPVMNDYQTPSAKQHSENVNRYFQRPPGYEWKPTPAQTTKD